MVLPTLRPTTSYTTKDGWVTVEFQCKNVQDMELIAITAALTSGPRVKMLEIIFTCFKSYHAARVI